MFHMFLFERLNLIGCQGYMKCKFSKNVKTNLLLGNHKMKLKLGIHAKDINLYINYVLLFQSDKNSGCYGNLYFT